MYEINPKFFDDDGSLDVEAACAAGRKARAHIIGEGARFTLSAIKGAARIVCGVVGNLILGTPGQVTK